ncbi:MAG: hypothetical protein GY809_21210 [Planctomycetes bacterium]|nr:hypothetical protein [Planctomycetota bacterium]
MSDCLTMTQKREQDEQKILHINGYMDNIELPANYQKRKDRSLIFIRYFVSPCHEAAQYQMSQIDGLRRYDDHLAIETVYFRLVRWASSYNQTFRGFVYDCQFKPGWPAEVADIALSCGIDRDRCSQYVDALVERELVSWLTMDQCNATIERRLEVMSAGAGVPADGHEADESDLPQCGADFPAGDVSDAYGKTGQDCADFRSGGQESGDVGPPAVRTEFEHTTGTQTVTQTPVSSVPPTENFKRSNARGPAEQSSPARAVTDHQPTEKTKAKGQAGEQAIVNDEPRTTKDQKDTPNQTEVGRGAAHASGPLSFASRKRARSKHVRRIRRAHWKYAVPIFRALKMGVPEDSEAGKKEIASFARLFVEYGGVQFDLPEIGLKEAHRLAKDCAHRTPQYRARNWNRNMQGKAASRRNNSRS